MYVVALAAWPPPGDAPRPRRHGPDAAARALGGAQRRGRAAHRPARRRPGLRPRRGEARRSVSGTLVAARVQRSSSLGVADGLSGDDGEDLSRSTRTRCSRCATSSDHELLGRRSSPTTPPPGYVILEYFPEQKVFIDDRYDMYPTGDLRLLQRRRRTPGWDAVLDRYDVEVIVWGNGESLAGALERLGRLGARPPRRGLQRVGPSWQPGCIPDATERSAGRHRHGRELAEPTPVGADPCDPSSRGADGRAGN